MAYMNQEKKAKIRDELKKVIPKNWKWSLSVNNHSTIVLTIKSAPVDLMQEIYDVRKNVRCNGSSWDMDNKPSYVQVNVYWLMNQFDTNLALFEKIMKAMKSADWYDNSDIMSDYFNTAYYCDINIGRWDKPFVVSGV